jgi:uncharacterized membrane protein
MPDCKAQPPKRPTGVIVVAIAAVIFGLGEIWVGLFGNYLGILSRNMQPSTATAIVGAFYSLGGLALLITRRTWGTLVGLLFIGAEVLGRIYLVVAGIAPSGGRDLLKIVIGGAIAIGFMSYIAWRSFAKTGA